MRLILGEHDITAEPGEVAEFDTRTPHWFDPADGEPVEILLVQGSHGNGCMFARPATRIRRTEGAFLETATRGALRTWLPPALPQEISEAASQPGSEPASARRLTLKRVDRGARRLGRSRVPLGAAAELKGWTRR
jgi:hypothetical protein